LKIGDSPSTLKIFGDL